MSLPMLVTGAIITETVFSWPGIGPYITQATRALDYPEVSFIPSPEQKFLFNYRPENMYQSTFILLPERLKR